MDRWVKVYEKLTDHEIMKDHKAFTVFLGLLLKADRNGKYTTGRFVGAELFGMRPDTFYKVLRRLEKKYKLVTLTSNNKYTEISFSNYSKYQSSSRTVTQDSNNKGTTKEQQSNTKQEYRIKNNTLSISLSQDTKNKIIQTLNTTLGTNFRTLDEENCKHWLSVYSVDEIVKAIEKIGEDSWLGKPEMASDMNTLLFRTKNKNGSVDYIGRLLNLKSKPVNNSLKGMRL